MEPLKIKKWKDEKTLFIESHRIEEYINFICSSEFVSFKGIVLSYDLGYKIDNVDFLEKTPFVESIAISDYIPNLSGLYRLKNLKTLHLAENKQKIDLSFFNNLENLGFDWNKQILGLDSCYKLKKLVLGSFNPHSKSISELPNLEELSDLTIIRSTITSLEGISKFKKLNNLTLAYLSKLERLDGLMINSLKEVEFSVCRKILNHSYLENLKNLKSLKLNDCGKMPSISFINKMPLLSLFSFVNTNVLNGDMSPLFKLELVGYDDKKHYSHSLKRVREIIDKNRIETV